MHWWDHLLALSKSVPDETRFCQHPMKGETMAIVSSGSRRAPTGGSTFEGHFSNVSNYLNICSIILNAYRIDSEIYRIIEPALKKLPSNPVASPREYPSRNQA
jgi:hypothetical protein